MAHLTVDQALLDQLNRGENIHVVINPAELVPDNTPAAAGQPAQPPQPQQLQQQHPPQQIIQPATVPAAAPTTKPSHVPPLPVPLAPPTGSNGSSQEMITAVVDDRGNLEVLSYRDAEDHIFICPWCDKVMLDQHKINHLLEAHNVQVTG